MFILQKYLKLIKIFHQKKLAKDGPIEPKVNIK